MNSTMGDCVDAECRVGVTVGWAWGGGVEVGAGALPQWAMHRYTLP